MAQRTHAFGFGLLRDVERAAVTQDDFLDGLRDRHHLVDADAALVATAAGGAADGAVGLPGAVQVFFPESCFEQRFARDVGRRAADGAQAPREALRSDQNHARRDVEGRDTHVAHPSERGRRVVGVQRGEHQVAGLRGLDRDIGGFEVADFADHDDGWILAQEGAQRCREGQAGAFVDVDLVDAREVDFRRIFRRGDVDARLVQQIQAGVERHRLARARGTGDEHHAIGATDGMQQPRLFVRVVAEGVDPKASAARVENTHDDLLAEQRGQRAHAEVDHAVGPDLELHAAVLRHAFLGDVEPGDDRDARSQLVLDDGGRAGDFAQFPVDPEAHAVVVLVRLEVDVRGPHADGVEQHLVQETYDRRVFDFGDRLIVALVRGIGRDLVELEFAADDAVDGFRGADGGSFDHSRQLVVFGDDPVDAHLGRELDFFCRLLVGRIGCGNDQPVVALAEDDDAVRMAQLLVDQILRKALRIYGVEIEQRGAEGGGEGVGEISC